MKKSILVLFITSCWWCTPLQAAQDTIKVYDLGVTMRIQQDTTSDHSQGQKMILTAFFKVNLPDSLSKVYFRIGQTPDGAELKNDTLDIVYESSSYLMRRRGTDINAFFNKSISYKHIIDIADLNKAQWLTIYLKTNAGTISEKKYFKIK